MTKEARQGIAPSLIDLTSDYWKKRRCDCSTTFTKLNEEVRTELFDMLNGNTAPRDPTAIRDDLIIYESTKTKKVKPVSWQPVTNEDFIRRALKLRPVNAGALAGIKESM